VVHAAREAHTAIARCH